MQKLSEGDQLVTTVPTERRKEFEKFRFSENVGPRRKSRVYSWRLSHNLKIEPPRLLTNGQRCFSFGGAKGPIFKFKNLSDGH